MSNEIHPSGIISCYINCVIFCLLSFLDWGAKVQKKDISCVLYFEKNAMKPVLIINKLKHKKKANNILRSPFM